MLEIWKDIAEFEGVYQVSNLGRVRSVERYINTRIYPAQIMKQRTGSNGTMMVALRHNGKQQRRSVAKLVLITFIGNPPQDARQAKHLDGDVTNNRLDNLRWDVTKNYFLPNNEKAKKMFFTEAENNIKTYILKRGLKSAVNFGYYDIDDFVQAVLWEVWKDINAYDEKYPFYTFCKVRAKGVFNRIYKKEVKKKEKTIYFEDMVTEKKPIDFFQELSYNERFEGAEL